MKVKGDHEEREHYALASWLDAKRLVWCHPSPNVYRAILGRNTPWNAIHKARAMGVKAGIPDILVFSPCKHDERPTAIELKRCKSDGKSVVSDEQKRWLLALKRCGWHVQVCYGCEDAIGYLVKLGY